MKTQILRWAVAIAVAVSAASQAQAFYNPQVGRFASRDPIGEMGGRNIYGFVVNNPVSRVDLLGLADTTVRGPSAAIFAWIASFDPTQVNLADFLGPYIALTGDASVLGSRLEFYRDVMRVLGPLAGSANPDPGSALDLSSMNTRGWQYLVVSITCGCDGRVRRFTPYKNTSVGFTPLPGGGFDAGEGNESISCSSFGTGVHCNSFERTRIGPLGQAAGGLVFPAAVGVPYRWSRIEYTLRCNRTYDIHYSASYFPSHRAYLDGAAVATSVQSGLANFIFAGNGVDAPGGEFHVESGTVP